MVKAGQVARIVVSQGEVESKLKHRIDTILTFGICWNRRVDCGFASDFRCSIRCWRIP